MEPNERAFRKQICRSIRLLAASSRLFNFRKRAELILTRLSEFQFDEVEKSEIEMKIVSVRRYLDASEIGAAKHELLSLASAIHNDTE